jgi:hypothetical protein
MNKKLRLKVLELHMRALPVPGKTAQRVRCRRTPRGHCSEEGARARRLLEAWFLEEGPLLFGWSTVMRLRTGLLAWLLGRGCTGSASKLNNPPTKFKNLVKLYLHR